MSNSEQDKKNGEGSVAGGPAEPIQESGNSQKLSGENPEDLEGEGLEAEPGEPGELAAAIDHLTKLLGEKEKEAKEQRNLALRFRADYENLMKRTAKQLSEAIQSGNLDFIKKLLPVVDTFESALRQIAEKNVDKKLVDGFEMTFIQFYDVLEKEGLKPIKAKGVKFDPNLHEALNKRSDPNLDDEVVVTEFEKGYTFKDRVVRPAKVEINQK